MGLSKASPRDLIHTREIRCRGYRRADGMWDIEGTLEDTKTYSFANHDRGGIAAGEPIHGMIIRLTLDDRLVVQAVEAVTESGPFAICGEITPVFQSVVGLRIGPGWRKAVVERMAGVKGCTHLTDLLLGPMTVAAQQTVAAARAQRHQPQPDGSKPALIDRCHALAGSSPVVKREWPAFYTPGK
ncbi:MAG: DUF2889 domain-containing protein [Hyphomicrobiales bacterium]|nr:DUF2889 domain-containing protein [Hyphomicrobiales bacterium]